MENLNLCEMLKGHEGETFYSPCFGKSVLNAISYVLYFQSFDTNVTFDILPNGSYCASGEICIFPSKDQRDWNKWLKTQNSIIKTFNDLLSSDKCIHYGCAIDNNYYGKCYLKTEEPIEKSAFALFVIHQLIELGYGGNITKDEWLGNIDTSIFIIVIEPNMGNFMRIDSVDDGFEHGIYHIAFHTKEQAEEFLSYPENIQLIKDYFMI